jgi:formylglycine-generating enzyme required for sulfatase activity
LEECKVPDSLSDWHWVNLFESQGMDFLFKSLELRANSLAITLKPLEPQRMDDIMLFDEAMKVAAEQGQVSISLLQRKLRISFTRSSHIISMMEDKGIIGPPVGGLQMHQVLAPQIASVRIATSKVTSENKLTLSNGMEFMHIPAGKFIMGSNNGAEDEKPQHTVDIPYDYWISGVTKLEVIRSRSSEKSILGRGVS